MVPFSGGFGDSGEPGLAKRVAGATNRDYQNIYHKQNQIENLVRVFDIRTL